MSGDILNSQDPLNEIVEYEANGQQVQLSINAVQQFVTKGNANITQVEAYNFIQLCKAQGLNPFVNDAYLIKFGNTPAQQVVGKEAFMKRANRNSNFNGYQAGVVVFSSQTNRIERKNGQAIYPGEELLGGWATVYRKDIEYSIEVEVSLQEFGKGQSTWKQQPGNMIRKVALVNALREAFPEDLGGMYTEEEPNYQDGSVTDVTPLNQEDEQPDLIEQLQQEQEQVIEEQPQPSQEQVEQPVKENNQPNQIGSGVDWDSLTVPVIKNALDRYGVKYPSNALKADLIALAEPIAIKNNELKKAEERQNKIIEDLEGDQVELLGRDNQPINQDEYLSHLLEGMPNE